VAGAAAYLRSKWHLDPPSRLATINLGHKVGAVPLFRWGSWVTHLTQCGLGRGLTSVPSDPSSPLVTIDMGRKLGASVPIMGGGAGFPSNTVSRGPRPASLPSGMLIYPASWSHQIWAKNWGLCPYGGGEPESPSKTMWPWSRPTCMPSFVLIYPTVWPQYTNVTDRRDRIDNGPIA